MVNSIKPKQEKKYFFSISSEEDEGIFLSEGGGALLKFGESKVPFFKAREKERKRERAKL